MTIVLKEVDSMGGGCLYHFLKTTTSCFLWLKSRFVCGMCDVGFLRECGECFLKGTEPRALRKRDEDGEPRGRPATLHSTLSRRPAGSRVGCALWEVSSSTCRPRKLRFMSIVTIFKTTSLFSYWHMKKISGPCHSLIKRVLVSPLCQARS